MSETLEEAVKSKWSLEKAQEFAISKFKSEHKKGTVTLELILEVLKVGVLTGHKFGVKWQQERSYSEEDMRKAFIAGFTPKIITTLNDSFNKWFEQFKKK